MDERRKPDNILPPLRDIGTDILTAATYIFDGIRICLFILVFICWLFVASSARIVGIVVDTHIYFVITLVVATVATVLFARLWRSWRSHNVGSDHDR